MKKNPPDKIFKILVVEDEESCLKLIKVVLEKEDYVVNSLNRGEYVLEEIQIFQPDLLVLDMDLPDITGWDLLKIIRSDKFLYSLLVLAISGKYAHSLHSIRALGEFGADDYLPKPFGYQLFISHVKALLRRKFWDTERELRTMRSGPITLDLSNRQAFFNGSPVHLTSSEFKVLFELLRNRGKALDRNRLLESIMGYSSGEYETRNVDKHIESLRRKIPEYSKRIVTVREIGYKFFVFLLLVLSQFSVLRADYTDTLRCLGKLIERVDKRPDDRVALKSLNDEIKKLISDEIHLRKREARGIMQQTQRKLKKIFSEALDNYNKKKYLFASEGFKCIAAYKPTDRKTKDYLYKIHSEMSALASCEVAFDAENLAYAKGYIYYNSGEMTNAVSEWERVLGINPSNIEVKHYLERTKRFLKEMIERERFERLKNMTQTVYERACTEFTLGNYERAIEKWEKVILISQKENSSYFEDFLKKSRRNISKALAMLSKERKNRTQEMPSNDVSISEKYYKEGLELFSLGRLKDAITRWDLSVRFNPSNEKALKAKENALRETGVDIR